MESTAIFDYVCDLTTKPEFCQAQNMFYDQYADKFEEEEENKLEYTDYHEAYIKIMDEVIDAKLREKYSIEDITRFFQSYCDNAEAYKAKNPTAVQTLNNMTDFMVFKENMLETKKLLTKDTTSGQNVAGTHVDLGFYEQLSKENPKDEG